MKVIIILLPREDRTYVFIILNRFIMEDTMDREKTREALLTRLEERGYRASVVSLHHLTELEKDIQRLFTKGLFDKAFYQEELTSFDFKTPDSLPQAQSLIAVAVPQPQNRVSFVLGEKPFSFLIPPTYQNSIDEEIKKLILGFLKPMGYRLVKAYLPLKLLAIRSGLALYGKNNIAYAHGMGSFFRLIGFYSDLPCMDDNWGELRIMESCKDCSACGKSCPASAIGSDRFLLHAERCLTYHNERSNDFPGWIDPSWHHCLVGCLICQKSCPINRSFIDRIEESEGFSQEETALLLKGASKDDLGPETLRKLERLGLLEYIGLLPRNLKVLFETQH